MPTDSASVVATLAQVLIADGRYPAGTRLAEIPVAEALGVSRTPVRLAFRTLEQEGLLQKAGKRGFVVREFSEADVLCAVEVRGVLEGLAARRLAERGSHRGAAGARCKPASTKASGARARARSPRTTSAPGAALNDALPPRHRRGAPAAA